MINYKKSILEYINPSYISTMGNSIIVGIYQPHCTMTAMGRNYSRKTSRRASKSQLAEHHRDPPLGSIACSDVT